jgi:hypothetical protein
MQLMRLYDIFKLKRLAACGCEQIREFLETLQTPAKDFVLCTPSLLITLS